jgi:DNA-binding MarR family transcriptional regulator/GNAT superfamily N-acetyltransferase
MPDATAPESSIAVIRRFNRFYTARIGVLQEGLLATPFSLTESRLLYEFAHREHATATELSRDLGLDAGYLSRLLRGFKERGLIKSAPAPHDARHLELRITPAGRRAFAPLDTRTQAEINRLLSGLTDAEQRELLQSMVRIEQLLDDKNPRQPPYLLRTHRPGDIGWVIERHGALYAREYRWNMDFEALVAHIAARFIEQFDAKREACWIAERDHANVGCVFLVQARDETTDAPVDGVAQLRLLLVEPSERGLGLGARLVAECERFALI